MFGNKCCLTVVCTLCCCCFTGLAPLRTVQELQRLAQRWVSLVAHNSRILCVECFLNFAGGGLSVDAAVADPEGDVTAMYLDSPAVRLALNVPSRAITGSDRYPFVYYLMYFTCDHR